jgi:uncharacterized cupredoxin-like copper-binding protein
MVCLGTPAGSSGKTTRYTRASMAAYYVLGIALVLFALGLFAIGQMREGFPPSVPGGRGLMATAGLVAVTTFVVLVASTEKEHPREHAKAEAAERAGEQPAPPKQEAPAAPKKGGAIAVSEKEYSVDLASGSTLKAGAVTFDVANKGKIQHDLAIEGGGAKEEKTPLIDPGKSAKLEADLKPGKYKLYCTVPGHEQLGMKTDVTVR